MSGPEGYIDVTKTPCKLHELTGCSICSGLDKKLATEEAQFDAAGWDAIAGAAERRIAPGIVRSQYSGLCAGCKTPYGVGAAIRHSGAANGWVGMECCG